MHWIKNYMCCNGKKWVLQKASLKIFEIILIPTSSIATYFMSVMFPGTKNKAQKITPKHWNACFYTGKQTTSPSDPQEKAALIPCAAFFMSSRVLRPRNAVCQSVTLPLLLQKARPPLAAISPVGRRAKPKQCGMSGPVPAGSCWPHLREWPCLCSQPRHRDVLLLPRGQNTQHSWPVRRAAHLALTFWIVLFLANLSKKQRRMKWFNAHDCAGCLFQNNFPKHAMKSEL